MFVVTALACAHQKIGAGVTAYASDTYSFGIVVWEILSRQTPWAGEGIEEICRRVVATNDRPEMPIDAPKDLADITRECWVAEPNNRPRMDDILQKMKARGWKDV